MKNKPNGSDWMGTDFYSIFMDIWKYKSVLLMCAVVSAVWSYIFLDQYGPFSYTSEMKMVIKSHGSETALLDEFNMEQAVERGLSVLNSEALENIVREEMRQEELPGKLSATAVRDSNMIIFKAKAGGAGDSFAMLNFALEHYHRISSPLIGGYYLEPLGDVSAKQTKRAGGGAVIYSLCISLGIVLLSMGVIAISNLLSGRLHNEDQARAYVDACFLGRLYKEKKRRYQKSVLITDSLISDSYAEEMEKFTTRLVERGKSHSCKSILVTSVLRGEGKSTVSVNLASALARRGRKVLLIEGDLRRPVLYKLLNKDLKREKELTDYLDVEQPVDVMLSKDHSSGCYYCLSRGNWSNAERLLESDHLAQILKMAELYVDYIVIDTPPAGIFRDAEILGNIVDAALLVVQEERAEVEMINQMIERLKETGTFVLGYVFNQAKCRRSYWHSKKVFCNDDEIDVRELLEDVGRGLRRFAPFVLLLFLILSTLIHAVLKLKYKDQYVAHVTYSVAKADDSSVNANLAKWLSNSFSEMVEAGLRKEWSTVEAKNTESAAMLVLTVKADTKATADALQQDILNSYPEYAIKSVGTIEFFVLDQSAADEEPVQVFSPAARGGISVLAGVCFTFALLVAYALNRKTIRRSSDLERFAKIPCLAGLPAVKQKKREDRDEGRMRLDRCLDGKYQHEMLKLQSKIGAIMRKEGEKSLLVTSSVAREGKTTIAVNLALAFAKKQEVLLIDGDFHHSAMGTICNRNGQDGPGLAEYLAGEADWIEIQHSIGKHLRVIYSGRLNGRLSSILTEKKQEDLKEQIGREKGYVILDAPPAAVSSETALFSGLTAHGLYVIRPDEVAAVLVREGFEQINHRHNFLLGYIFNDAKHGKGDL